MFGWQGKILKVDLSSEKISSEPLNENWAKNYIGGSGLACRMLYDMINKDTDPLGPENPLIFMTGPLTATPAPTTGRYVVCAKSPLTNIWGESTASGLWGAELKLAGFDGILFVGKAKKPVYLLISGDNIELRPAKKIWKKTTVQTHELIQKELNDKRFKVLSIGLAGVNLVRSACIMNDEIRAAGRTGMGAVMGSKNLKAIAIKARGKVEVAKSTELLKLVQEVNDHQMAKFTSKMFKELGTAGYVDTGYAFGDMVVKYYTEGEWDGAAKISGSEQKDKYVIKDKACFSCPIRCRKDIKIGVGKFKTPIHECAEYETIGTFGALPVNEDLESIMHANYLCNAHGVDTISTGATIAFAMYMYDKGYITKDDTDGLEIKWGDSEMIIKLLNMIIKREGFGDILAEGTLRVGRKFEVPRDEIGVVKGLDVPMHDPRANFGMGVNYSTAARGACHMAGDDYEVAFGNVEPAFGIVFHDRFANDGIGEVVANEQDYRTLFSSLILCNFAHPTAAHISKMLEFTTGIEYPIETLRLISKRSFNLKRAFNNKMGITRDDDYLPKLFLTPLKGGTEGKVPDYERHMKEYYEYRNWDEKTGKPKKELLKELSLDFVIKDLWGNGGK
ncbi:MAG: aldehyde ferredoxin oxidoreductase family protein [Candidatus Helarchaeota archaeon]